MSLSKAKDTVGGKRHRRLRNHSTLSEKLSELGVSGQRSLGHRNCLCSACDSSSAQPALEFNSLRTFNVILRGVQLQAATNFRSRFHQLGHVDPLTHLSLSHYGPLWASVKLKPTPASANVSRQVRVLHTPHSEVLCLQCFAGPGPLEISATPMRCCHGSVSSDASARHLVMQHVLLRLAPSNIARLFKVVLHNVVRVDPNLRLLRLSLQVCCHNRL